MALLRSDKQILGDFWVILGSEGLEMDGNGIYRRNICCQEQCNGSDEVKRHYMDI